LSAVFDQLFEVVKQIIEWLGYPGIFILMLVENLVPPVPSEMVIPFGGALVAQDRLDFGGLLLAGTLGSVVGAVILYYLGYRLGRQWFERWTCRYGKYLLVSVDDLHKALDLFQRHGKLTVFLARLVPGARSLISIPAGVNRMPFGSFIGLTLVGTFLWNILLAGAGYMLGRNWERALELLDRYELILWVTAGVLMFYFFVRKYQQRGSLSERGRDCEEHEA
jgi:membrane protein DedA with SNARE-associated domain